MAANTASTGLTPDKRRLGLALLAGGPITHERLVAELDRSGKGQSVLGKALLQTNFPREEELLAVLVARVRIPKINVRNTKIPLETIRVIPPDVARKTKILAIEKIGEILVVVSPDIGDENALALVRQSTGCLISPIQCAQEGFDEILEGYYGRLATSPAPEEAVASSSSTATAAADAAPSSSGSAVSSSTSGGLPALPGDEGGDDQWARTYVSSGPLVAEEVLL